MISLINLSLQRREYLSPAVNVLTKCLKIFQALTETFSNAITFKVINECCKGAVIETESVFRPVYHVPYSGFSEGGLFRYLSNHVFRSP